MEVLRGPSVSEISTYQQGIRQFKNFESFSAREMLRLFSSGWHVTNGEFTLTPAPKESQDLVEQKTTKRGSCDGSFISFSVLSGETVEKWVAEGAFDVLIFPRRALKLRPKKALAHVLRTDPLLYARIGRPIGDNRRPRRAGKRRAGPRNLANQPQE